MSVPSIRPYFPFRQVKITGQAVALDSGMSTIKVDPDQRFSPLCSNCQARAPNIHSHLLRRRVRDLPLAGLQVTLDVNFRKVRCPRCGIRVEELGFVAPGVRVTKRLAHYVAQLCRVLPIKGVAEHLGLDWKTVKAIDKAYLEENFGRTDCHGVSILAIDEISVHKGHRYMTVVLDYETGRVLWMGRGRSARTLKKFFRVMSRRQRRAIKAVAMDMWTPYLKVVRERLPQAKIVWDFFHAVKDFNKVVDQVRLAEYRRARWQEYNLLKGSKYLFLKNCGNLTRKQRLQLDQILAMNERLIRVYILKDALKLIWRSPTAEDAKRAIEDWCAWARESRIWQLNSFIRKLQRHRQEVINHCYYPISTGRLEGTNNKIKVIKRQAYGFHDDRYFALKVKQAFSNCN